MRPHGLLDRGILTVSFLGIALHPFVVGLLLRRLLSLDLGVAPYSGYCPIRGATAPGPFGGVACGGLAAWAYHLYLPWICFALFFLPMYTRMFRTRVLGALGEPYVRTARAKGASEARVVRAHVLRNAIVPIVPMLAMDVGTAITTAIYIEAIFDVHGLGTYAIGALSGDAGTYDLAAIMQVVFVVAVAVVVLNLVADLVLLAVDPRITGRSGRRGLWRTDDGGIARRRVVIAAAAAALAVGGGVALAQRPHGADQPRVAAFARRRAPGRARLARVAPLRRGLAPARDPDASTWGRTAGSSARASRIPRSEPVDLVPPAPDAVDPRAAGFSLQYVGDATIGPRKIHGFVASPAVAFDPPLPSSLPPDGAWVGSFAGPGPIPHGTDVYVGVGQFAEPGAAFALTLVTNTSFKLH